MAVARSFAFAVTLVSAVTLTSAARAAALWVEAFESRMPFKSCLGDIDRLMHQEGMTDINGDAISRGGTKGPVRTAAVCVRREHAGPCNNDGLSIVISAAGDTVDQARGSVDTLHKQYGNPCLIDCN